jgi:hypothetical protein
MAAPRRIVWLNVITVVSAAILIGAEVFGAAFAGSWALATLFDLGSLGQRLRALRHCHHGAIRARRASDRAVHRPRLSDARRDAADDFEKS